MSTYDIVETDGPLARLVDRVVAGETVTLRRNGRAVARVTPAGAAATTSAATHDSAPPWSAAAALAHLDRIAIKPDRPQTPAVDLIRQMRDERP